MSTQSTRQIMVSPMHNDPLLLANARSTFMPAVNSSANFSLCAGAFGAADF